MHLEGIDDFHDSIENHAPSAEEECGGSNERGMHYHGYRKHKQDDWHHPIVPFYLAVSACCDEVGKLCHRAEQDDERKDVGTKLDEDGGTEREDKSEHCASYAYERKGGRTGLDGLASRVGDGDAFLLHVEVSALLDEISYAGDNA